MKVKNAATKFGMYQVDTVSGHFEGFDEWKRTFPDGPPKPPPRPSRKQRREAKRQARPAGKAASEPKRWAAKIKRVFCGGRSN